MFRAARMTTLHVGRMHASSATRFPSPPSPMISWPADLAISSVADDGSYDVCVSPEGPLYPPLPPPPRRPARVLWACDTSVAAASLARFFAGQTLSTPSTMVSLALPHPAARPMGMSWNCIVDGS